MARLALPIALLFGTSCEEIGNPLPLEGETPLTAWISPYGRLLTETRSLPAAQARPLEARQVDYRDDDRRGRVRTLVGVNATWSRSVVPARLRLVTTFELRGGKMIDRTWEVVGYLGRWRGLFSLPDVPVAAMTRIE